ncbi:hypothetical protein GCM10025881_37040 [Pseudolysinimonas kribbensis]|uniref:Uncharacterized protein n=1 Tax=Pseudolysinimonas kribbensis TaxID=433641 RepID=A0ABQ6KE26_9MICO|nr:hypothetical protein GCM10025881_37040 [Pseudolysinimonas kribbensis]
MPAPRGQRGEAQAVHEHDHGVIDGREAESRAASAERVEASGEHIGEPEPVRPASGESGRR